MTTYHKINSIFKRDMDKPKHPIIMWDWVDDSIEMLKEIEWHAYEKIDGTNIRCILQEDSIEFKGRTDKAETPKHLLEYLKSTLTFEKLNGLFDKTEGIDIVLYGEGYGHKIQRGGKYLGKEVGFILFDIKVGHWYLEKEDVKVIAEKLNIPMVPFIAKGTLSELIEIVTKGMKSTFGDFYAEGLVATPKNDLFLRNRQRAICKIKHVDLYKE